MKKIILLILCLFVCNISINAKTIVDYKNKLETSPIIKYKIKHVIEHNSRGFYEITFSIKGKLVDKNKKPLANKEIEIYSINKSLYHPEEYAYERFGKKFIIHTNAKGIFSETFNITANISSFVDKKQHPRIQDAEIHLVFSDNYDAYYMEIEDRNKNVSAYAYNSFEESLYKQKIKKFEESTIKYKLINGQNIYSIPNPIRIIYKYPFDKVIKIIPYDKNDTAQLIKNEESTSNIIVLDTVDLSAEYFRKKQDIIDEARKMLNQEDIYTDVNNLILENNSIKDNWREIIELEIRETKEKRKQEELEKQKKEQKRQDEIEKFKHDPDLHNVKSQISRCPNCYRFTLGISLIMRTGDPYHIWLMMFCPECSYYKDEFRGF